MNYYFPCIFPNYSILKIFIFFLLDLLIDPLGDYIQGLDDEEADSADSREEYENLSRDEQDWATDAEFDEYDLDKSGIKKVCINLKINSKTTLQI